MKFCLAFMMHNEEAWLRLHLPVLLRSSAVDGIVAVDGGSTDDSAAYVKSLGGTVFERPWDWKPLDQENAVIRIAEWCGYDALLLTAPDELWWPAHIDGMKALMDDPATVALQFPTWNFVRDRRHYAPQAPYFPDFHQRVWRLGQGIRHVGELDSVPTVNMKQLTRRMDMPMYHFSHIKPRDWYTLKGLNFHRVQDGLEPLDALPEGFEIEPYPMHVAFPWPQPLEPDEIGERAPYV